MQYDFTGFPDTPLQRWLARHGACHRARRWVGARTLKEVYDNLERIDALTSLDGPLTSEGERWVANHRRSELESRVSWAAWVLRSVLLDLADPWVVVNAWTSEWMDWADRLDDEVAQGEVAPLDALRRIRYQFPYPLVSGWMGVR